MIQAVSSFLHILWQGFFRSVSIPFLGNISLATFLISIFLFDLFIVVAKWLILGDISFGISQARASRPKETHTEEISYNSETGNTNHVYKRYVSRSFRKKRR